jgi:aminopeptidase N
MTDEAAATAALALSDTPLRDHALDRFYMKWRGDPLVVNKWLAMRALSPSESALREVRTLTGHEAFDRGNPNKVRSLIGVFSGQNLAGFHRADGAGYRFFAEEIIGLDAANPQLAARLMSALESWRKLEPVRRRQVEAALKEIIAAPNRSANLYEMASRLLGGAAG